MAFLPYLRFIVRTSHPIFRIDSVGAVNPAPTLLSAFFFKGKLISFSVYEDGVSGNKFPHKNAAGDLIGQTVLQHPL